MIKNKKHISESLEEWKDFPDDDVLSKKRTFYKVVKTSEYKSFCRGFERKLTRGYDRNTMKAFGAGAYLNVNLEDACGLIEPGDWATYGDCILGVKIRGGLKNFVFYNRDNPTIAKLMSEVYGSNNLSAYEQLKMITGDENVARTYGRENPSVVGEAQSEIRRRTGKTVRGIVYLWNWGHHPVALPFDFGDVITFEYAPSLPRGTRKENVHFKKVMNDEYRESQRGSFDTIPQMEMMDAEVENLPWLRCQKDGCIYVPYKRKGAKEYNLVKIDEQNAVNPHPKFILPISLAKRLDDEPSFPDEQGVFEFNVDGLSFYGIVNLDGYDVPAYYCEEEEMWYGFEYFDYGYNMKKKKPAMEESAKRKKRLFEGFSQNMSAAEFVADGENRNVFVCAHSYSVDGIFKNGFSRQFANDNDFAQNGGALTYGEGQYGTPELSNAADNLSRKTGDKPDGLKYGNVILKCVLINGFSRFLILDKPTAERTYGKMWRIFDQIDLLVKDPKDNQELKRFSAPYEPLSYYPDKQGRTNHIAFHMFDGGMRGETRIASIKKWTEFFRRNNIRGVVYRGNGDGYCFVCYNFSEVVPIAASYDYGKTWTSKQFDWNRTRERLSFDNDMIQKVGHLYKRVSKITQKVQCDGKIFGLTIVETKNDKFNYVFSDSGEKISPYDFDYEPSLSPDGWFDFEYKGKSYIGTVSLEGYGVPAFWYPYVDENGEETGEYFTFDRLEEISNLK